MSLVYVGADESPSDHVRVLQGRLMRWDSRSWKPLKSSLQMLKTCRGGSLRLVFPLGDGDRDVLPSDGGYDYSSLNLPASI